MSKTVLSYGGTGVQGGPMARAFAAAGYQTRTITRDPSKPGAQALAAAGVDVRAGDLGDMESLAAAHEGVDIVALIVPFFVQPPSSPLDYMRNAVQAAEAAGVERLVWNPSGSLTEERLGHPSLDFRHDFYDVLQASTIPHVVVAPNAYMENLMGPWTANDLRQNDTLAYPLAEGQRLSWLAVSDMAALMVAAAGERDLVNTVLRVNGPENLTGPEMAERFTQALGRPIAWQSLTPQEFGQQIGAVMGPEAGAGIAANYETLSQHFEQVMTFNDMSALQEQLGVSLTPLAEWVAHHAAAFQATETA